MVGIYIFQDMVLYLNTQILDMKRWGILGVCLLGAFIAAYLLFGIRLSLPSHTDAITLPEGFRLEMFAENVGGGPLSLPGPNPGPRMMLLKDGIVFVSLPHQGKITALEDRDGDGVAETTWTFVDGLHNPHGIDYFDGWFYIAEETRVIRLKDTNNVGDKETIEILIPNLPSGGHFTRTVKAHGNKLYVSIGSSCNVCIESDERRASILECELDGSACTVFAKGIRNAVGFVFEPGTGKLYATENGRDWLGDDAPPDEINMVEEGKNYGWPLCYGKNIHDTEFDKNVYIRNPCMEPFEIPSMIDLQAHSAPLGLAFYTGEEFPSDYRGDLFVAYHGSWNRGVPTGYKIVRIDLQTLDVSDFATGWLQAETIIGRPVDIINYKGGLLVSDDTAGKIYRIFFR